MSCYERVADTDAGFIPDLLDPYFECARNAGLEERAKQQLQVWADNYDGASVVLKTAALLEADDGAQAAAGYLAAELDKRPSVKVLNRLMGLKVEHSLETESGEETLRKVTRGLLESQAIYRCSHCGFSGHVHNWQCPSCKHWSTTRVIRGVLGE